MSLLSWAFLGQKRLSKVQKDVSWKLCVQQTLISELLLQFRPSKWKKPLTECFFHPLQLTTLGSMRGKQLHPIHSDQNSCSGKIFQPQQASSSSLPSLSLSLPPPPTPNHWAVRGLKGTVLPDRNREERHSALQKGPFSNQPFFLRAVGISLVHQGLHLPGP